MVGAGMLAFSMTHLNRIIQSLSLPLVPLFVLVASSEVFAKQESSGPPSPSVDGTSPLLGYLIAVVLLVLLVVVSIIPSKRHFEDI